MDQKGRGMVKVCEDEDRDNEDAKREFEELSGMESIERYFKPDGPSKSKREPVEEMLPNRAESSNPKNGGERAEKSTSIKKESSIASISSPKPQPSTTSTATPSSSICPICSLENPPLSLTCAICANVLRPEHVHGSWRCASLACKEGMYINAGDVAFCGVCGGRKGI